MKMKMIYRNLNLMFEISQKKSNAHLIKEHWILVPLGILVLLIHVKHVGINKYYVRRQTLVKNIWNLFLLVYPSF